MATSWLTIRKEAPLPHIGPPGSLADRRIGRGDGWGNFGTRGRALLGLDSHANFTLRSTRSLTYPGSTYKKDGAGYDDGLAPCSVENGD